MRVISGFSLTVFLILSAFAQGAAAQLQDIPEANVIGVGCVPMEDDYVPHVVACENGAADFEALKAQAVAARTYAYYTLIREGSIIDGQGDQVYTCGPQPLSQHYAAVNETACEVLTYPGTSAFSVISSFYVAGAFTTYTGIAPDFMNIGADPTNTEQFVTYNFGLTGANIDQTSLGFQTPNPLNFPDNRGCMSQNGSDTLAENGWDYLDILRYYYGDDIGITTIPNCGNGPHLPACVPPDCNENGVDDETDLADGTSSDCNNTGIPDECELEGNDCNLNGIPDECDFTRQIIWEDDFDVDTSSDWSVFSAAGDFTSQFLYNYASDGIAPAPNSVGGTTRGLRFTVNNNDGIAATDAVSAYPIGESFDGNFALEFDMWLSFPPGGTGTTEYATAGINHIGDRVVWQDNGASDGFWFAVTGEGGANNDYVAFRNATLLSVAAGGFVAGSLNASSGLYQNLFPPPTFLSPGSPGREWVHVQIIQDDGQIDWVMNGTVIASRTDTSITSGNIMVGLQDVFSSIASPASQSFVLYDNVRVTIPAADCNFNGNADECDILAMTSLDCNANVIPDECETIPLGDFDLDGSVGQLDLDAFVDCLAGPATSPDPANALCTNACIDAFDYDDDGDVDLADFQPFGEAFGW